MGLFPSDGKSVTFTTTLSGTLYAVYPSDATDAEKIVTEDSVPVTLKAEQDGTFGNANICVAKENDGSLAFKNVTSVLHLTQTAATTKVNEIIITTGSATAYIAGTGTVDMSTDGQPALTLSSDKSNKIKVESESVKSDYYIAVVPTTLPAGTAFGFATGSKLGGTNLSEAKTIAANTIYNIGSMDANAITPNEYHDYVEIEMTVNSVTKKYKWATKNIGASNETEAGYYFAWGYAEGCVRSGSGWFLASSTTTAKQFNTTDFPYRDASSFQDAATANWGGSWRMPTKAEFDALCALTTKSWETNYEASGVNGYEFTNANSNSIFLPAAGFGNGSGFFANDSGRPGRYWSSSVSTGISDYSIYLYFGGAVADTDNHIRNCGLSVRALSE